MEVASWPMVAGAVCWAALSGGLSKRIFSKRGAGTAFVLVLSCGMSLAPWLARLLYPYLGDVVPESSWAVTGTLSLLFLILGWSLPMRDMGDGVLRGGAVPVLVSLSVYPLVLAASGSAEPDPSWVHAVVMGTTSALAGLSASWWARCLNPCSFTELESTAGKHLLHWGLVLLGVSAAAAGYDGGKEVVFEPIRIPSPGTAAIILGLAILLSFLGFFHGKRRGLAG